MLKVYQFKRSGSHVLCGEISKTVNELLQLSEQTITLTGEKAKG